MLDILKITIFVCFDNIFEMKSNEAHFLHECFKNSTSPNKINFFPKYKKYVRNKQVLKFIDNKTLIFIRNLTNLQRCRKLTVPFG
jgi:hypothetical protein